MSRTPCASPAWPSAYRALRPSTMTVPYEAARQHMQPNALAIRPKIQTWSRSDPLVFAQSSGQPASYTAENTPQRTYSSQTRGLHTIPVRRSSDKPTATMASNKRSKLSTEFSFDSNRERDLLEAEAFAPLYGSSRRDSAASQNYALSTKRKAGNDVPYSVLRKEDSDESFVSASTEPYASDGDAEAVTAEPPMQEVAEEATVDEPDAEESEDEPEEDSLFEITHHINQTRLKKAMKAAEGNSERYWKYTLYEDSEGKTAQVHYCQTIGSIDRVVKAHFTKDSVIGFDLEWVPFAKHNAQWWQHVSVMQLATQTHIAVLHLSEAVKRELESRKSNPELDSTFVSPSEVLSETLIQLLANPAILKPGVNVGGDASRMRNYCDTNVRGIFELSHLYKLVEFSEKQEYYKINRKLVSMAAQTQQVLRLPMFKGDVRTTDWSQKLNTEQILYAASDAYCGLQLFISLDARRRALKPRPPRPAAHETGLPIKLGKGITLAKKSDTQKTAEGLKHQSTETGKDHIDGNVEAPPAVEVTVETMQEQARRAELYQAAEEWAEAFMTAAKAPAGGPKPDGASISRSQLRTYFLWHHKQLEDNDICNLLKLKAVTVGGYVRWAVYKGRLPHDKNRLAKLKSVPSWARQSNASRQTN